MRAFNNLAFPQNEQPKYGTGAALLIDTQEMKQQTDHQTGYIQAIVFRQENKSKQKHKTNVH